MARPKLWSASAETASAAIQSATERTNAKRPMIYGLPGFRFAKRKLIPDGALSQTAGRCCRAKHRDLTKAEVQTLQAESVLVPNNPTVGSFPGCARAAKGHAAAAPPSSVMNSRRVIRSPRRRAAGKNLG